MFTFLVYCTYKRFQYRRKHISSTNYWFLFTSKHNVSSTNLIYRKHLVHIKMSEIYLSMYSSLISWCLWLKSVYSITYCICWVIKQTESAFNLCMYVATCAFELGFSGKGCCKVVFRSAQYLSSCYYTLYHQCHIHIYCGLYTVNWKKFSVKIVSCLKTKVISSIR